MLARVAAAWSEGMLRGGICEVLPGVLDSCSWLGGGNETVEEDPAPS